MNLKDKIAEYPNFPKKGILFRDFSPVLKDPSSLSQIADEFSKHFHPKNVDIFAGIESRGFFWSAPIAYALSKPFVLARKPGKLPRRTVSKEFILEYGTNSVHIHADAIQKGEKILIVDDLIATGGTAIATAELCVELGASEVHTLALIDLPELGGSKKIKEQFGKVLTLIDY